jgi:hypothetical protein
MTEAKWEQCGDPSLMLAFACGSPPRGKIPSWWFGRSHGRKLRLFAAACVRRFWHLLTDERSRRAVEVGERYADGLATDGELRRAGEAVYPVIDAAYTARDAAWDAYNATEAADQASYDTVLSVDFACQIFRAAWAATHQSCFEAARYTANTASACVEEGTRHVLEREQAALLRDVVGPLPFRPVSLPPFLLAWNDRCVVKLATGVYEERDFSSERMGVLADALEDAGCSDPEFLGHLRSPGPHVRGCWVVDLILERD